MEINTVLSKFWNEDSKRIPLNKDKSPYAVDKESLFPRNAKVCELGGGMGVNALYFLRMGHEVFLLDISDRALDIAQKAADNNHFSDRFQTQQVDLSQGKISQENDKFDVVFSRLALHYFGRDTLISLYKEIHRILKTGGVAFLSVKSADDEKEMEFIRKKSEEIEPGVFKEGDILKSRYTDEQLEKLLSEAGITNFKVSEYKEPFGGRDDVVKSGNTELLLTDIEIWKYKL